MPQLHRCLGKIKTIYIYIVELHEDQSVLSSFVLSLHSKKFPGQTYLFSVEPDIISGSNSKNRLKGVIFPLILCELEPSW